MANPLVVLLMGSDSDLPTVKEACAVLQDFGVAFEAHVLSAHRTPDDLPPFVQRAEQSGGPSFIAGAGRHADCAGPVAPASPPAGVGLPACPAAPGGGSHLLDSA